MSGLTVDTGDAMADLDPAHVEAVAHALCPRRNGRVCASCYSTASRVVADPSSLLAALVRAGVLTGETRSADVRWKPREGIQRRYVTRWEDVDA